MNVQLVTIYTLWFSKEVERAQQVSMLAALFQNGNAYFIDTRSAARLVALNVPQPVAMS